MSKKAGKILTGVGSALSQAFNIYNEIQDAPLRQQERQARVDYYKALSAAKTQSPTGPLDFNPPSPHFNFEEEMGPQLSQAMEGTGVNKGFFTPNKPPPSSLANVGGNITRIPTDVQQLANRETNIGYQGVNQQRSDLTKLLNNLGGISTDAEGENLPPLTRQILQDLITPTAKTLKAFPSKEQFGQQTLQDILQKTGGGEAHPTVDFAPLKASVNLSPDAQAAAEWIKAHPKDPRVPAIKAKYGLP